MVAGEAKCARAAFGSQSGRDPLHQVQLRTDCTVCTHTHCLNSVLWITREPQDGRKLASHHVNMGDVHSGTACVPRSVVPKNAGLQPFPKETVNGIHL